MTADIAALHRHGLRSLLEAWLLMLAGRAGTAGLTGPQAAAATGADYRTVRCAFSRLIARRLIITPSRDTAVGGPLRYCVTPMGLHLLQSGRKQDGTASQMSPLPLAL